MKLILTLSIVASVILASTARPNDGKKINFKIMQKAVHKLCG